MKPKNPIMTDEEIVEYFNNKGYFVNEVKRGPCVTITFPSIPFSLTTLQKISKDLGDPGIYISCGEDGHTRLVIYITKNPFKK